MTRESHWLDRLIRLRVDPDKGKGRRSEGPDPVLEIDPFIEVLALTNH